MNNGNQGFYNTYGSETVNGQLAAVYERSAFKPGPGLAPQYQGRGAVFNTIATDSTSGGGIGMVDGGSMGGLSDGTNAALAQAAADDPFNPRVSPVIWHLAFLIIGFLILRYVHWRA